MRDVGTRSLLCQEDDLGDKSVTGSCKLCGVHGPLCKSHVIPEFAFGPVYGPGHKMMEFESASAERAWKIQKGWMEYMLCLNCEGLINTTYETPFKEYWFDSRPLSLLETQTDALLNVPDYSAFKLFHLSVLLRAHFATHQHFASVELGQQHSHHLASLVLNQDPGEPFDYPILCFAMRSPVDGRVWWETVFSPLLCQDQGAHIYEFAFAGCQWLYYVASHHSTTVKRAGLQPDGTLPVIKKNVKLPWRERQT